MNADHYTGELKRQADGTYAGQIVDRFGWPIQLTARVVEVEGRKQFALTGKLGPTPEALRIELIDGKDGVLDASP